MLASFSAPARAPIAGWRMAQQYASTASVPPAMADNCESADGSSASG
jgi:hypothetical protein